MAMAAVPVAVAVPVEGVVAVEDAVADAVVLAVARPVVAVVRRAAMLRAAHKVVAKEWTKDPIGMMTDGRKLIMVMVQTGKGMMTPAAKGKVEKAKKKGDAGLRGLPELPGLPGLPGLRLPGMRGKGEGRGKGGRFGRDRPSGDDEWAALGRMRNAAAS
eukprot:Skav218182  [mRNA]  locus=scaffold5213:204811:207855:- [translate_table: standard]